MTDLAYRQALVSWRQILGLVLLCLALLFVLALTPYGEVESPDSLIEKLTTEMLTSIQTDPNVRDGDFSGIEALVDAVIMPHVDLERTTQLSVGRSWREATPKQRVELVESFRVLLVATYAGALSELRDETVRLKPQRASDEASTVIVRSEIIGRAEPIELAYRMERVGGTWKIFDLSVLGVWVVNTYRGQFRPILSKQGIAGLISSLADRNQRNSAKRSRN